MFKYVMSNQRYDFGNPKFLTVAALCYCAKNIEHERETNLKLCELVTGMTMD